MPYSVINDGDVSALAGAMSLNDSSVLGIAMGTSEAVGYVDEEGRITGWLNELAFVLWTPTRGPNAGRVVQRHRLWVKYSLRTASSSWPPGGH